MTDGTSHTLSVYIVVASAVAAALWLAADMPTQRYEPLSWSPAQRAEMVLTKSFGTSAEPTVDSRARHAEATGSVPSESGGSPPPAN